MIKGKERNSVVEIMNAEIKEDECAATKDRIQKPMYAAYTTDHSFITDHIHQIILTRLLPRWSIEC
jgi:hypothetical protein